MMLQNYPINLIKSFFCAGLFFCLTSCKSVPSTLEVPPAEELPETGQPSKSVRILDDRINEASGLIASRSNPGIFWVHNDSGDRPRFFAVNEAGQTVGVYTLVGANARDWEDMAMGPSSTPGTDFLYLADVGDNNKIYDHVMIYQVEEPLVDAAQILGEVEIPLKGAFRFFYPDKQHNAETIWVDPFDKGLYIMTKQGGTEIIFRGSLLTDETAQTLEEVAQFTFPRPSLIAEQATGGDLSQDGLRLLVKSYGTIYLWVRDQGGRSFFESEPVTLPYVPEPQGEAIAWAPDGAGYYTLSEERNDVEAVLYYYPYPPKEE